MTPSSAQGSSAYWRRLAASVRDLPAALRLQLTPASAALMVLLLVGPGTLMIFVPTWQAVAAMVALVAVLPPLILAGHGVPAGDSCAGTGHQIGCCAVAPDPRRHGTR